jgi:hypothetical protein
MVLLSYGHFYWSVLVPLFTENILFPLLCLLMFWATYVHFSATPISLNLNLNPRPTPKKKPPSWRTGKSHENWRRNVR